VFDKKTSSSRLVKSEKAEFTRVNEHFSDKRNAELSPDGYRGDLMSL